MQRFRILWLCLAAAAPAVAADALPDAAGPNLVSLAELQRRVAEHEFTTESFRVEGLVRAALGERRLVALQDDSAAALLELPALTADVRPGQWIAITANHCGLARNRAGLQLGTTAVVDNDGNHPPLLKTGSVYLDAGFQPIHLAWFNGFDGATLQLAWEGPGVRRQPIPDAALRHAPPGATSHAEFEPGLHVTAYEGTNWDALPDFSQLDWVAESTANNFNLAARPRPEDVALVFDGWLDVPREGVYTFYLNSDDGARLFVGNPAARCEIAALPDRPPPAPRTLAQAIGEPAGYQWVELEGVVTFAGPGDDGFELEVSTHGERVQALIIDSSALTTNLLRRYVRLGGVCETVRDLDQRRRAAVIVPGLAQIQVPATSGAVRDFEDRVLTAAEDIRRLKPAESREHLPAKVRGVVTQASDHALVLQDATAGVFIHYTARDRDGQPRVGELWEVAGTTDPGDFSPVIFARTATFLGEGAPPEPIRPTWDQLMNGSLDAQFVELHGVITAVSEKEMTLLTPDGKLRILASRSHPMPRLPVLIPEGRAKDELGPDPGDHASCRDCVVRIRGCLTAEWDAQTRQVIAGEIYFNAGTISVEEPRPADPFAIAARNASDLLSFDARASALQRTKIAGQIIRARPREYCLLDGDTGVRVLTREALPFQPGDLVQAVGFPQAGGPSPVLQEAQARKTGTAPLPEPVNVASEDLLNRRHDATLVRVDALLVSDTAQQGERILELQSGPHHFLARLNADRESSSLQPGSRLQLTGVYASARADRPADQLDAFELWLNDAAAIRVLQQPPWWTVRRAIAMAAALAGGLGLALVWITLLRRKVEERTAQLQQEIEERQRLEHSRALEQERTRVARDLHDELGAGLTEVGILGSLAKNASIPQEQKNVYLDQLVDSARSLVTGLDEIVWAVNPQYDSVPSLASYYALFAQRFLNLAGIACRLQIAEGLPEHPLDSRVRHGIFLAFKEALNNVVRHSGATEVRLQIDVARDRLMIAIADNGNGFPGTAETPGQDGLAGMFQRMHALGGKCDLSSRPGEGTTVELSLPLGKAVA